MGGPYRLYPAEQPSQDVEKLMSKHRDLCFANGDHPDEVDSVWSRAADCVRLVTRPAPDTPEKD